MTNIRSSQVAVPLAAIEELHQKLALSIFPDETDGSDWKRGVPVEDIKRITKYWHDKFSWASFEERLNKLPHFEATISIEGFDPFQLHFIHQKSANPDAIPLLFIHGWPGSFLEATKILPMLTDYQTDKPSFHVIVPSLPNFGFSSKITKPGFGLRQYSEACHQLMLGLGYQQYASQGGDLVGTTITTSIGALYPQSLRALHLNLVVATPPSLSKPLAFVRFLVTHLLNLYTPQERSGLRAVQEYKENGNGYFQVQKTRPNTIGILLADSPAGLLAWIYEKLVMWSDKYQWTDQEVCEWGFSYFPREMFSTPRMWNRQVGDVVYEREHEQGGHFAAWEQPEVLVDDIRTMFDLKGPAYRAFHST
ncbi:hypothetical protein VMCG_10545 [Cytospora schulzeri]|uniref:Epoxide hydrolase N-terminal domain-containing protein n=1 Tax=Cytospora schulzeri TaxID=448051 RepID=A0A423VAH0_9PEZI|nr:hypothetical protein VMCG_10545 [Valsa malicola]